jgi:hypothetical protein
MGPSVHLNLRHFLNALASHSFEELKDLQFMESSYGNVFDKALQELRGVMALQLPNLQSFRFANMSGSWWTDFGFKTFLDFKALSVLDLDYGAFLPETPEHGRLLEPLSRCPPGL